jgi:hypothetical protein
MLFKSGKFYIYKGLLKTMRSEGLPTREEDNYGINSEKLLTLGEIINRDIKEKIKHEGKGIFGLLEVYNKWRIKLVAEGQIPGDLYLCHRCNKLSLDRNNWYSILPIPKRLNEYLYIPIDKCWFCEKGYENKD